MRKLNIGCGKKVKPDYINLDMTKFPGVDFIHDLNKYPWPFKVSEFDEIYCDNILEHLNGIIRPLEEIWRITRNGAIIKIKVPLYPSVGALQDPTHKQFYTYMTFDYFRPKDNLNYYSKARFKIIKKKIIFHKYIGFMNFIINLNEKLQKFYYTFFAFIIPPMFLEVELKTLKKFK